MSRNNYRNASDVLSQDLIQQIQDLGFDGMYLYIPSRLYEEKIRQSEHIGYLRYEESLQVFEIADRLHLSKSRVQQLLRNYRRRHHEE